MQKEINTNEAVKRYAASMGIDVLNLIKTMGEQKQQQQTQMAQAKEMELVKQTGQLASTPLMDPSKNPDALTMLGMQNGSSQTQPPGQGQEPTGIQPNPA
jgi:hypothetical protein